MLAERSIDERLTELTLQSPALHRATTVRVLTPAGFDPNRDHLPVLWLLHGGFGSAADWTTIGAAEALTAELPLIVVMPDAGIGSWYADWLRPTSEGPQRWETYHVRELVPFIEQRYSTRTDRGGHAIAGVSMGGFGAMHDAARHPDVFGFAASFSGAVDLFEPALTATVAISPLAHGGLPGDIFGDPLLDRARWRAHNPVDLAANLATVAVELHTGNGQPGGPHGAGGLDSAERSASAATATLHGRLGALGIDHVYDAYGPGGHNWDYFRDELASTLPGVMAATARPSAAPTTVDHLAYESTFSVWGFDVSLNRSSLEATVLSVRPDGFGLSGSGAGVVTTPPSYSPGEAVLATSTTVGGPTTTVTLLADPAGRVAVPVDLGKADSGEQLASLIGERRATRAVSVSLARASGPALGAEVAGAVVAGAPTTGGGSAVISGAPTAAAPTLPESGGFVPWWAGVALLTGALGLRGLTRQASARRPEAWTRNS